MIEIILSLIFFVGGTGLYYLDHKVVNHFKLKKFAIIGRTERFQAAALVSAAVIILIWIIASKIIGIKTESISEILYMALYWLAITLGLWFGPKTLPYFLKAKAGEVDPVKDFTDKLKQEGKKLAIEVAKDQLDDHKEVVVKDETIKVESEITTTEEKSIGHATVEVIVEKEKEVIVEKKHKSIDEIIEEIDEKNRK